MLRYVKKMMQLVVLVNTVVALLVFDRKFIQVVRSWSALCSKMVVVR